MKIIVAALLALARLNSEIQREEHAALGEVMRAAGVKAQ